MATMTAAVRHRYGGPEVLEVRDDVPRPDAEPGRVLVRVRAASVNRADWYVLLGRPALMRPMMGGVLRPKSTLLGGDFAGTVEAVGAGVEGFAPGDEVFGSRAGAFGEYVAAKDMAVAHKPANVTFEEAAAVPVAALTALQGLRDHGRVRPGRRVLVNGASGGVGTFAVQIAKALGAEVTAVCSSRNVELARSLGADRVLDYAQDDFTRGGERYDVVFDVAGSRPWSACKRVLERDGALVLVGAPSGGALLGPLRHLVPTKLASLGNGPRCAFFVASFNRADMETLLDLLESGKVKPVVSSRYALRDVAAALREMGEGHVQGKIVVTV